MTKKTPVLGKGLSALLTQIGDVDITSQKMRVLGRKEVDSEKGIKEVGVIKNIPLGYIKANPFQPRNKFDKESLLELAKSISELGIIQPVTVRKLRSESYQLIVGERRFRASQIAGLKEIPAFVRLANDRELLEIALVENIQRKNLDAIEIALSYQKLIEECDLTQDKLSKRVGKKRSTVANYLRLLRLPLIIQSSIIKKDISMGHARALLSIEDEGLQIKILEKVKLKKLSVRQLEEELSKKSQSKKNITASSEEGLSEELKKIQKALKTKYNENLRLVMKSKAKKSGKLVIPFNDFQELETIKNKLL